MVGRCGVTRTCHAGSGCSVRRARLKAYSRKPWAIFGAIALAWWYYAAPIHLAKRIRGAVEEPGGASIIASRVDFERVNARLPEGLRSATPGHLSSESCSHLLLHGWLPQQSRKVGGERTGPDGLTLLEPHTRLTQVRYKDLNRFMAMFWDTTEAHEIVLTLRRKSVLHRWYVTEVNQFNVCAYDFDCAQVAIEDFPAMHSTRAVGPSAPRS